MDGLAATGLIVRWRRPFTASMAETLAERALST
jgi:hypothetical protein